MNPEVANLAHIFPLSAFKKSSSVFWESLHFCSIIHVWQNLLRHYCALKTGNSSKIQHRKNKTCYCPWRVRCKAAGSVLSSRLIGFCPIVSVHGCWMYSKTSQLLSTLQTFLLDLQSHASYPQSVFSALPLLNNYPEDVFSPWWILSFSSRG